MNRDSDRAPRSQRYQPDDEQYGDPIQDNPGSGTPRRRRSQAARLRTEDQPLGDTITPRPRMDTEAERRYGRPATPPPATRQQQQRKQPPARDLYDDDPYYDEDGYDEEPYSGYERPAPKNTKAKKPQRDDRYREDYDDYDRDGDYDDSYRYGEGGYDEEPPRKKKTLRWVIIIAVIVVLLAAITFVGLNNPKIVEPVVQFARGIFGGAEPTLEPTPLATETPEPTEEPTEAPITLDSAVVIGFLADPTSQPDINSPVLFTVTTTLQTDRVEIVDANGQYITQAGEGQYTDTDYGRQWALRVYFPAPYEGEIEVNPGNEAGWNYDSSQRMHIKVGDPDSSPTIPPDQGDGGLTENDLLGSGLTGDGDGGGEQFQQGDLSDIGSLAPLLGGQSAGNVTLEGQAFTTLEGAVSSYTRQFPINMGDADAYAGNDGMRGVLTFRGSNMRQNAAYGTVTPVESSLELAWSSVAGIPSTGENAFGSQPLIVQWHQDIRELMTLNDTKLMASELKEVIFAGNNGYLYFYDLSDGQPTREALPLKPVIMPMLGTPSVSPAGFPLMITGIGDPMETTTEGQTGFAVFNMLKNVEIGKLPGQYEQAFSTQRAVTTSPLIDNASDSMLGVANNGLLYTMRMNTTISGTQKTIGIEPSVDIYRSGSQGQDTTVDSALAAYGNYAYYATNGGILQCVDVNTLTPVWAINVGADTDAAIALQVAGDGSISLYLATRADAEMMAHMYRIDAMTGVILWDTTIAGNISASPLVGTGALDGMVFFAASSAQGGGKLLAKSISSGDTLWELTLSSSQLSSPLALYNDQGGAWIVQGEGVNLLLVDPLTGTQLSQLSLDGIIYGSPAAFNDMIVVATGAGQIHGVRIK